MPVLLPGKGAAHCGAVADDVAAAFPGVHEIALADAVDVAPGAGEDRPGLRLKVTDAPQQLFDSEVGSKMRWQLTPGFCRWFAQRVVCAGRDAYEQWWFLM